MSAETDSKSLQDCFLNADVCSHNDGRKEGSEKDCVAERSSVFAASESISGFGLRFACDSDVHCLRALPTLFCRLSVLC